MATAANKANGQIDKSFCTPNRTNAGDPNGTLTPEYGGEIVFDETNNIRWKASGAGNHTWYPMDPDSVT